MAQTWDEALVGDAPDGPLSRQDTVGTGELTLITGSFDGDLDDHVDTYSIVITDTSLFYATTAPHIDANAFAIRPNTSSSDTALYLWDVDGNPLLGGDNTLMDDILSVVGSTLSDPSTFTALTGGNVFPSAAGISLNAGRKYLLTITYRSNDPEDPINFPLISLTNANVTLSGPNPGHDFDHWENDSNPFANRAASYGIALRGAAFCVAEIPCTCPADINNDGGRDGSDVQGFVECLVSTGSNCSCADVDGTPGLALSDVTAFVDFLIEGDSCP